MRELHLKLAAISWGLSVVLVLAGASDPLSAATVGYWRFEEASGDTPDVEGIAGTMTAFNITPPDTGRSTQVPISPITQTGAANTRSFFGDGVDNVFSTNGGFLFNDAAEDLSDPGAGDFTVEAWINITSGIGFIAGKGFGMGDPSEERGFGLAVDPDLGNGRYRVRAVARTTAGGFFDVDAQSSPAGIPYGEWHHVAAVREGDNFTIFVNGVAEFTRRGVAGLDFRSRVPYTVGAGVKSGAPGGPATFSISGDQFIGAMNEPINGLIDEVRISNVALDPAEFLNAPPVSEVTWLPNSGSWNNRFNWSPTLVPNIGRSAVFGPAGGEPQSVFSDAAVAVKGIRFENPNTHAIGGQGSLTLDSNEGNAFINVLQGRHELQLPVILNDNVDVNVETGAALEIDNRLNLNGRTLTKTGNGLLKINYRLNSGAGAVVVGGGVLAGVGRIGGNVLNNAGSVAPGQSVGHLSVAGNYTQAAAGTLAIEIASLTNFDVLTVDGAASLSGRVEISLLNGFAPSTGNSFDVLTATSVATPGLSLTGAAGFSFQVVAGNILRLTFGAAALAGDYNGDGVVNAADYVVWRKNPASFGGVPAGFNTWRANFGATAGSGSSAGAAVPEPSAVLLWSGTMALLLCGMRRVSIQPQHRASRLWLGRPRRLGSADVDNRFALAGPNKWLIALLCCFAALVVASRTARAQFQIAGVNFTEIFQDDFSGIGISEGGPDQTAFYTDNGNGLNVSKWTWDIRRAARIERDGSGFVLVQSNDGFPSGASSFDDVIVSTRSGQLSALTGASQWGYEVRFIVNEQFVGSPSSGTASGGILVGKTAAGAQTDLNAARDVSVVVREGVSGLTFDLFHSTGLILTAGGTLTPLATNLNRGQEYLLGIHHVANDQVNYYLDGVFVGTFTSNNNGPPEVLLLGDASAETFVDFSFNSFKVGTTVGGPPVTELRWFRDASGDWNKASNWMFGVPNTNQETAIFGDAILGNRTVFTNVPVTVKEVRFDNANSYAIMGPGSVNLEAATGNAKINVLQGSHEFQLAVNLHDTTEVAVANGAVLNFNNELNLNGNTLTKTGLGTININNALTGGILDCQQGTCGGSGQINGDLLNSGGTLSPGNSSGVLEIVGDYSQGENGTLRIEVGGTNTGIDYDQLIIRGTADLGGALVVVLANDFDPAIGNRFNILAWRNVAGTFDHMELPALPVGLIWDTSELYTMGTLAVGSAVPEASTIGLLLFGLTSLAEFSRLRRSRLRL